MQIRWFNAIITALATLASIALAWWLGWVGVGPSWVGLVIFAGAIALLLLEVLAWWLAHENHNLGSVITANATAALAFGFFIYLSPKIGWKEAGATVGLMLIWATSVAGAAIGRRR